MTNDARTKWAARIAQLLAKAESTTSREEADALIGKAQELMTKFAIDSALLDQARGLENRQDEIVHRTIEYTGIYADSHVTFGYMIAQANACQGFVSKIKKGHWWRNPETGDIEVAPKHLTVLHVIGFETDVNNAMLLDASLQIQMTSAMRTWWDEFDVPEYWSKMDGYKTRRSFLDQFAATVTRRLKEARRRATQEAETTHGTSVALVLRSRSDELNAYMDQFDLRERRSRRQDGDISGRVAGHDAGTRANIGQPGVGSRGRLGQG